MPKIFGYARISTEQQTLTPQIDALKKFGADVIYTETTSGAKSDRPELEQLIKALSAGDTVVVYKLDRISRSTKHLIEFANYLKDNDIHFTSLQDGIDTSTSMGKLFFHITASIAEFERDLIIERTKAGLEAARARGRVGGRPKTDETKISQAIKLYNGRQHTVKEIEQLTNVSRSVLYRALAERK